MAQNMLAKRNRQVMEILFPGTKQTWETTQNIQQQMKNISSWIHHTSENIDKISDYINQSDRKAAHFLQYFTEKQTTKVPYNKFVQRVLDEPLAARQSAVQIDPEKIKHLRKLVQKIKKVLDDFKTKGTFAIDLPHLRSTLLDLRRKIQPIQGTKKSGRIVARVSSQQIQSTPPNKTIKIQLSSTPRSSSSSSTFTPLVKSNKSFISKN